jgi:hypothetical protein
VGRHRINNIATIFDKIWNFINDQPTATLTGLQTTGGKGFSCQAKITRDQRKYISLPHSNRVYESDWGYYFNDMGKEGQRIGQYSIPINERFIESKKA